MKKITENAWLLPLGPANAVLLRDGAELTLVDAGFPGKAGLVFEAIRKLGHRPENLKHLVFTHAHRDHIGSAAEILQQVSAETWMHAADAAIAETGGPFRPITAASGAIQRVLYHFFWLPDARVKPVHIDHHVMDGEVLPAAGGLRVAHVPGHCAGQIALLWQGARLLIVADAGINYFVLGDPIGFEDEAEGHRSQEKISKLDFSAAAFGHGFCIRSGASEWIRRRWGRISLENSVARNASRAKGPLRRG